MALQHSLPIYLTFVPCTAMLGVLPTKFWTWYITDKNSIWLRFITEQEHVLSCKVCYCAFQNILTTHLSKPYRLLSPEVLALVIHQNSYHQKVMWLHSSLALSTHREISHTSSLPSCPSACVPSHTIMCSNTPHSMELSLLSPDEQCHVLSHT